MAFNPQTKSAQHTQMRSLSLRKYLPPPLPLPPPAPPPRPALGCRSRITLLSLFYMWHNWLVPNMDKPRCQGRCLSDFMVPFFGSIPACTYWDTFREFWCFNFGPSLRAPLNVYGANWGHSQRPRDVGRTSRPQLPCGGSTPSWTSEVVYVICPHAQDQRGKGFLWRSSFA